jgi:signal transduction histidine kinase
MGLALVRSIVEAHGGTIRVAPRDNGAEFLVVLPNSPAAESAPPSVDPHAP